MAANDSDASWKQEIHNRPARVDRIYSDVAKVWYLDSDTLGYVPIVALGGVCGER